jgi:putative sterol carrier protein
VAEFLSEEWIAELDAAAASLSRDSGERLTIEQRVHGAPGLPTADVIYHLVIEPPAARVAFGAADQPDVTITTDYDTARALHEGRTTAQHALVSGRYKVRGRLTALRVMTELDDVFAPVRARTTFPDANGLRSDHDANG